MKKCPKCGVELKTKVLGSIEVDECESCKGVWLEKGELEEVKEETDPNLDWLDFEIWKHPKNLNRARPASIAPCAAPRPPASNTGTRGSR